MKQKIFQSYYDFFDKQIGDSTLVVGIIGLMIFLAWFLSEVNGTHIRSSIQDIWPQYSQNTIVYIDGKKYKIHFELVE